MQLFKKNDVDSYLICKDAHDIPMSQKGKLGNTMYIIVSLFK